MAGDTLTTESYIKHHLTNMTYGKLPEGYVRESYDGTTETLTQDTWTLAHNDVEMKDMGFMAKGNHAKHQVIIAVCSGLEEG